MITMLILLFAVVLMLVGFILWLVVLIKQFRHGGALQGIIGLITGIWTFIWGWLKHKELQMTKLMTMWTLISLILIATPVVALFTGVAESMAFLSQFKDQANVSILKDALEDKFASKQKSFKLSNPARKQRVTPKAAPAATGGDDRDWAQMALVLWQDGQYTDPNQAKAYWDKAIATHPEFAEAYNNRGLAFYNLELYQQAIDDFTQAIRMQPQYAAALNNRGNVYYQLDKYELASADFDQSLQLKPKYSKAHLNRGLTYFQMQKLNQACNDFRRACDLGECDGLQWAIQNSFCK